MKLSVKQLLDLQAPLQNLALSKIDAATAFRVGRIISKLQDAIQAATVSRDTLIRKHGTATADGKLISVPAENMEAFQAELAPVLAVEEEFEITPLPLSALKDEKISPADMMRLGSIIADDLA